MAWLLSPGGPLCDKRLLPPWHVAPIVLRSLCHCRCGPPPHPRLPLLQPARNSSGEGQPQPRPRRCHLSPQARGDHGVRLRGRAWCAAHRMHGGVWPVPTHPRTGRPPRVWWCEPCSCSLTCCSSPLPLPLSLVLGQQEGMEVSCCWQVSEARAPPHPEWYWWGGL